MRSSRIFSVDAIVIKRKNVGEADRRLTLFSKQYGRLTITAKGVRKITSRRGPHVEVFTRVIATIHTHTLSEVATLENYKDIRRELVRVAAAYYLCELVDGLLPEEQPHREVFELLVKALRTLETVKTSRVETLRIRFALALLKQLGFLDNRKVVEDVDGFVEQLLERRLKTVRLAKR